MMTKDDIEQIFRSNYRTMLLLANRMVHDEDAARDIVHDVFASLLSGSASAATPSYLLSGVRFACLKYIRSLSVRERLNKMYALDLSEIEDEMARRRGHRTYTRNHRPRPVRAYKANSNAQILRPVDLQRDCRRNGCQ